MSWREVLDNVSPEEIEEYMLTKSRREAEAFARAARKAVVKKYPRRSRTPLYNNLPREFTSEQLYTFLSNVHDVRDRRAFLAMLIYGLRVGEVSQCVIVPNQSLIEITNDKDKNNRKDYMPLIPGTELLFSACGNKHYRHLSRRFNETKKLCNFDHQYGESTKGRPLYQFTTHSMRHTGAAIMFSQTNSTFKTQMWLRHRPWNALGHSAHYIRYPLDAMRRDMFEAFAPLVRDWVR